MEQENLQNFFNRTKQTGDWLKYRRALTGYSKVISEAKRNSFGEFCGGMEQTTESSRVNKALDKRISSACVKKEEGKDSSDSHKLFSGSYSTAEGIIILPDTPTTDKS